MNNDWVFDEELAKRFHAEAITNIPSYHTVIDKSLGFANLTTTKNAHILDVGSAIGYTVKKFLDSGYTNVYGVESSQSMIEKSQCKDRIFLSSTFPKNKYNLVIMNWTLHFIKEKEEYLRSIFENLVPNGYLILTEKTLQSDSVKTLYYDFKMNNGVAKEYILEKEQRLKNIMFCHPVEYYFTVLKKVGFSIEILHADLGFVTFLCQKASLKHEN